MPSSAARQVALPGSSDTSEHQQSRHAAAEEEDGGDHIEYRQAREIPFELREHCTICFEEGLCKFTHFMSKSGRDDHEICFNM